MLASQAKFAHLVEHFAGLHTVDRQAALIASSRTERRGAFVEKYQPPPRAPADSPLGLMT
jgi:hypothetical protein